MGNPEKTMEDGALEKKERAIIIVNSLLKMRVPLVPVAIIFVIISKFIFRPFSNFYLVSALIMGVSLLIFPVIYIIKRLKESLSHKAIYLLLAAEFFTENILIFSIFFLLTPVVIYYIGGGVIFILVIVFVLMNSSSNPIFNNKNYSYFLFSLSLALLFIFGALEYFGIHPVYSSYPVENLYHPYKVNSTLLSLIMSAILLSIINYILEGFWNTFRKQTKELESLNRELENKVKERTEEIEEAKSVLEVRVQSRTKELKELADSLEDKVGERTQELQERVNELEKFHQLTVGRELKMIGLKDKIRELEEKLKNLKQ